MSAECQHFPYEMGSYIPHINISYNGCVPITRNSRHRETKYLSVYMLGLLGM